ncbi:AAA family ATPase [Balneola sp. MJW-20]|uniref:AAA family ATPase n=1 Tax=Gracilimonas aurantiaca TaxID=3234185 RepID=UPI00346740D3
MKLKILAIAYWAKFIDAISVFWRFFLRKAKKLLRPVQLLLGFEVVKDNTKSRSVDISSYLTETDEQIRKLPEDFRHVFTTDEEIERDCFINISNNLMNFETAYKQWDNGFPASMMVVGEKGSGKSTFIRLALKNLEDAEVVNVTINDTSWKLEQMLKLVGSSLGLEEYTKAESIIRQINNSEDRKVVVLENIQNLYLRTINGFDALEALWLIISETKEKVLWVCSCSRYAWQYLVKVEGVDTHFTHITETDKLDEDQIRDLIMKRCEKYEFKIVFESDESTRKSRSYRKRMNDEQELQAYLRNKFFDTLHETSEGNSSVALLFWLRSVVKVEDGIVYIRSIHPVSIDTLDILNAEVLFVMAVIVFHDTLRVTEVTRILNMSLLETRVVLTKLRSRGILNEKDGWYLLNQMVYRQTIRLLKSRNIIH